MRKTRRKGGRERGRWIEEREREKSGRECV